jgi:hypothetical protein
VLLLAEAALFGLPTDLLEAAGDLTLDENDRALRESVLRGDAGAVEKLRERTRGLRGAGIRLLAAWVEGPEPAREAAAAMGHLAARRVLAG